ncbi:hypothetical protein [Chelativorans salis]|uniref:Fenitrothion hydrolase n=1 Tax=Chelativorans salis TaxID=2978478 RepID=A0ABT2LT88_9HYPH|nr:hypothetical protein [Chelativorans sp. EGI FJ00035]MCT7376399.1 hypothetical protein [Chelativorans sp. EGI FJ00035]
MRFSAARCRAFLSVSGTPFAVLALCGPAFAHASERGHVLLLPTQFYALGGAVAVAASFIALVFLPPRTVAGLGERRLPLANLPIDKRAAVSFLSFVFFTLLLYAGISGSRDPLANPLPLTVWTLLWVGLTLAHGLFGNLWGWLNPWYGPWTLFAHLTGRKTGWLKLPARLGYKPALLLLFAFAWFELIDTAPDDPARLAAAALAYWLFAFAGMCLFGYEAWTGRMEFLSVFFRMLSRLSLFEARKTPKGLRLSLGLPGGKLMEAQPLPPSGVAFLLLGLASVSFDGLMRTFFWLGLIGINPLEFPGRSAVMWQNTLGLLAVFLCLGAAFALATWAGERLAGGREWSRAAGLLVWSIVPIALAYHFSHYLTALLVNGQYALAALSDPFFKGWNLFGTSIAHVDAGMVLGARAAWVIWNAQAAAIVAGHVLAVVLAHAVAYRLYGSVRRASLSQIPMTVLMIGYTVFGLWLLSTPTAG